MFKLRDFFPLPQVSALVKRVLASGPGLTVVAGFDPHLGTDLSTSSTVLPSGRAAIFRALMDEMFASNESAKIFIVTADKSFSPVRRRDERRIGRVGACTVEVDGQERGGGGARHGRAQNGGEAGEQGGESLRSHRVVPP